MVLDILFLLSNAQAIKTIVISACNGLASIDICSHTLMSILQETNLPFPHGDCVKERELLYFDRYSQAACYMECLTEFAVEKCHCRDIYMPSSDTGYNYIHFLRTSILFRIYQLYYAMVLLTFPLHDYFSKRITMIPIKAKV